MSRGENCDLEYFFQKAMKGRDLWLSVKKVYKINEEWCVVIMPDDDLSLKKKAVDVIPEYLNRKYLKKAIIIESWSGKSIDNDYLIDERIVIKYVADEDMNNLLRYYKLNQMFKNVVVISLKEPFGTTGIIGKCGITLDDYVRDALFV